MTISVAAANRAVKAQTKISPKQHVAAIAAAAAAFLVGPLWYSPLLFGNEWMRIRAIDTIVVRAPSVLELIGELLRILIVSYTFSSLIIRLRVVHWTGVVALGVQLWLGFQAMAILGGVLHEGYPLQLYLIHSGHALAYMLLMSVILGVWLCQGTKQTRS